MFEAKRNDNGGGSDFAMDDITVPLTNCANAPMAPTSAYYNSTGRCQPYHVYPCVSLK